MTAPTKLAKWRECSGPVPLTPTAAARHFGITRQFYEMLERGVGASPPSLAMHIATKTDMVVMPGDLPGCSLPEDSAAKPTSPATAVDDGEVTGSAASPSKPFVHLVQSAFAGEYTIAVSDDGTNYVRVSDDGTRYDRFLTAREAADFGMDLIRAALLAARPGSVPA